MNGLCEGLDYQARVVERYRRSGLSRKAFCDESGIAVTTLDYYVRRMKRGDHASAAGTANRILPVEMDGSVAAAGGRAPGAQGGVRIHLVCGRAVEVRRGFDEQLLLEVLAVLEGANPGERA